MTSPAANMTTGLLRASAFGATKQRRQQAGSRSVAAARGEGRKALSANRLSSLTKLFLGNTGARAGDKPSRFPTVFSVHKADLPAQRVSLRFRARPTAAGGAYSLEHAGRYFSNRRPAPSINLDHLSHTSFPAASASFDKRQIGRGVTDDASHETDK